MSLTNYYRKTHVRLGFFYLCLFLVATLVGLLLASYLIDQNLNSRLDQLVVQKFSVISRQFEPAKPEKLVELVNDHIGVANNQHSIYQLQDIHGQLVATNSAVKLKSVGLSHVPAGNEGAVSSSRFSVMAGQIGTMTLWVGLSDEETRLIKLYLREAALVSALIAITMVVLGTGIVTRRYQRRLSTVQSVLRQVSQGEISKRLPLSNRADDIDTIAVSINTMLDELQASIAALDASTTNIAHDMRSPISRVFMDLDDALRKIQSGADVTHEIESAQNELAGITRTFDALLRIARVEKRTRKDNFCKVDLSTLVSELCETFVPVAQVNSILLVYVLKQTGPVLVNGDEALLTQLLINLLENAIRYCPTESTVSVQLLRIDDSVLIEVIDNGPGIPENEREKVFQRLYRVDSSRNEPGSGLGLSLVRAIATLHDGSVRLSDSHPGLVVTVLLPAST